MNKITIVGLVSAGVGIIGLGVTSIKLLIDNEKKR